MNDINAAYNLISNNKIRNEMIVNDTRQAIADGRTPLILTRYKEHAKNLLDSLSGAADYVFLLYGDNSDSENFEIRKNLKKVLNEKSIILIATGQKIGEGFDFGRLAQLGEEGVDLLLSDSTNALIPGFTPSERTVGESLKDEFAKAKGRIILAAFASHVHRLQQIVNIATKHGRKIAIDGRSMVKIFEICSNLGYLKIPRDTMIDIDKVETYPANKVLILCTGTQGEPLAALSRIANGTHKHISLREGDTVVISATPIPGNEKAATKNINQLMKRDANVVFEKGIGIHVSGHGCQEEQKLMINLVKPKYFLPVHGEYAMIKKHKELAMAVGIPEKNVVLAENGAKLELSKNSFKSVGRVPSGATFIDGFGIGDVGNAVLKDRQNLADDGIVIITISQYRNGKFNRQVELVTRGFVYNKDAESLLSETKKVVVQGLDGYIIAEEDGMLLICKLSEEQRIKQFSEDK